MKPYQDTDTWCLDNEKWLDIAGFEGQYQISDMGRVRSLLRYVKNGTGKRQVGGKVLHQKETKYGYLTIGLQQNGKKKFFLIHRLVAEAFLININNLPQVNHIDENKTNNRVDEGHCNLEWCTASYNVNYGTRNIRLKNSVGWQDKVISDSVPVVAYDKDGNKLVFSSMRQAGKKLGVAPSNITKCLNGTYKKLSGYVFKHIDDNDPIDDSVWDNPHSIKIIGIDSNGNKFMFDSLTEASKKIDGSTSSISACCKGRFKQTKGWYFQYAN